jgi:riboflavin synthase
MFTGIVEGRRPVVEARHGTGALQLSIDLEDLGDGVGPGDSIAVNGCCLTVADIVGSRVGFHVMAESLGLTNLGKLEEGHPVNIERSLQLGDRMGGHFVTGHIDGVGTVTRLAVQEGQTDMTVAVPRRLMRYAILKGSISLDGVSLTLTEVGEEHVAVALIPHTLEMTTLGIRGEGDAVNLEMDLIGKWVQRLAEPFAGGDSNGSRETGG